MCKYMSVFHQCKVINFTNSKYAFQQQNTKPVVRLAALKEFNSSSHKSSASTAVCRTTSESGSSYSSCFRFSAFFLQQSKRYVLVTKPHKEHKVYDFLSFTKCIQFCLTWQNWSGIYDAKCKSSFTTYVKHQYTLTMTAHKHSTNYDHNCIIQILELQMKYLHKHTHRLMDYYL